MLLKAKSLESLTSRIGGVGVKKIGLAMAVFLAACNQQNFKLGTDSQSIQNLSSLEPILSSYPWVQGTTEKDGSTFSSSGSPVLASLEQSSNSIWVRQFGAGKWQEFGGRIAIQTQKFVSGNPVNPLLALTSTDVPVIAYMDGSTTKASTWNGISWSGYPADWNTGTTIKAPLGLAVDSGQQNRPAVLLGNYNSSGTLTKLQVYMLIGGRMKAVFGSAVTSAMNPTTGSFMRLDSNGVPVIVLQKPEPQGASLAVAIQNPQSYTWIWKTVGTIPKASVGITQMDYLDITPANQPLVSWRVTDFSGAGDAFVSRLEGAGFVTLGGAPVRARGLQTNVQTKISTDGTIYALLTNGGFRQPAGIDVGKFDGTAWTYKTNLLSAWLPPLSLLKDNQNHMFLISHTYQSSTSTVLGILINQFSIP
jgi:hypothetical protein